MEINQKHKIKATVISPLSIGQGSEKDWVEGIDYIREDGILYHLNLQLMAEAGIPMEELAALYSSRRTKELKALLLKKLDDIYDFSMELPVESDNPIKTFYFNPITGKYVLFGSSLKGAIRSAVFHTLTHNDSAYDLHQKRNNLDKSVFGDLKDGSNFMRFIRIGDFDFESSVLVNTKIFNLYKKDGEWTGGWKHQMQYTDDKFKPNGFNTIYECLAPGAEAEGYIMISPLLFNMVSAPMSYNIQEKNRIMSDDPIRHLFKIINDASLDYIRKELHFFETYQQADYADRILASLNKYRERAESYANSDGEKCLVKMSAGSGFHSITGDWQFSDYAETGYHEKTGKKKYKSRKIACYKGKFTPMGFLELSVSKG